MLDAADRLKGLSPIVVPHGGSATGVASIVEFRRLQRLAALLGHKRNRPPSRLLPASSAEAPLCSPARALAKAVIARVMAAFGAL